MINCSCNVLTKARILAAARELAALEPDRPITPGRLFRALGARPRCGTCFSLIRTMIAEAGLTFTCPEPLATVAEETETIVEVMEVIEVVEVTVAVEIEREPETEREKAEV
jgi:bacterioferritin-associated ferredoxin